MKYRVKESAKHAYHETTTLYQEKWWVAPLEIGATFLFLTLLTFDGTWL